MTTLPLPPPDDPPRQTLTSRAKQLRWWLVALVSLAGVGYAVRSRIAEFATIRQVLAIEHAVAVEHERVTAREAHYDAVSERDIGEHQAILRELNALHGDVRLLIEQAISIKRAVRER